MFTPQLDYRVAESYRVCLFFVLQALSLAHSRHTLMFIEYMNDVRKYTCLAIENLNDHTNRIIHAVFQVY